MGCSNRKKGEFHQQQCGVLTVFMWKNTRGDLVTITWNSALQQLVYGDFIKNNWGQ
jgi:hypothetical protein